MGDEWVMSPSSYDLLIINRLKLKVTNDDENDNSFISRVGQMASKSRENISMIPVERFLKPIFD